jgi:hypothetical protein
MTCLHLCHVKLALYMDDTAVIAMSHLPVLFVKYLETYLSDLERWLREWRIAINVSKSSTMLFAKAGTCIPKPRPVQLLGEPIQWVYMACYLGVTLNTPLIWSTHIDQVKKESGKETGSAGTSPKQEKWSLHQGWSSAAQAAHLSCDGLHVPCGGPSFAPTQQTAGASVRVFTLLSMHHGTRTLVTSKFTMIWESLSLPTTSDF